jgi:alkanesulfonate monooxygenase SsuD/methylene tetrahydromethanopterin reductase-like flavin-dependent oxidoreductase (luciferase family)
MKFSIFLPSGFTHEFATMAGPRVAHDRLVQIARAADDSGYESVLMPDHLTAMQPAQQTQLEGVVDDHRTRWTDHPHTTWIAGCLRRLPQPGVGRQDREHRRRDLRRAPDIRARRRLARAGLRAVRLRIRDREGTPTPTRRSRSDRSPLVDQDETTFDGTFYRVDRAINQPKGLQRPHIPLMIAGSGEKVSLRTVAR